ncbi:MAG TPA: hypothetical protein DCY27_09010 [Desulfobacterales bacterium]|nr:hypothetical protein [Desulfobacterales bacterium]
MSELIPELHDVLKLTENLHAKQVPAEFKTHEPCTRTWDGVLNHHTGKDDYGCPFDRETFLLSFADKQASSFNRHLEEKYKYLEKQYYYLKKIDKKTTRFYVHKLWNPSTDSQDQTDALLKGKQITELLEFMKKNPSYEEFIKKYGDRCLRIPEDKHWWLNVTSIQSHMTVTGKIYRILDKSNINIVTGEEIAGIINQGSLTDRQKRKEINSLIYEDKAVKWQVHLAKITLEFHQKPFRARDLRAFDKVCHVIRQIMTHYPDNVLLHSDNELILLYDDDRLIDGIVEMAQGLLVIRESCKKAFAAIGDNIDLKQLCGQVNPIPHYPTDLPETIEPPLCAICQMAHASYTWPDDLIGADKAAGEPKDELCEDCFNLRGEESRLKKLALWTGETTAGAEDTKDQPILVA